MLAIPAVDQSRPASGAVKMGADVVAPKSEAANKPGGWNRYVIQVRGGQASVTLNGKVVVENAEIKGLPAKVHNPPLEFHASKDDLNGLASYNPATECQAKHDIVLEKVKPAGL